MLNLSLGAQADKHGPQIAKTLHRHDQSNNGKRHSRNHQPRRPEIHPSVHDESPLCTESSGIRGFASFFPSSDPISNPTADNPKAANPAKLSLLCRKKNGTIAPAAPISIAQ